MNLLGRTFGAWIDAGGRSNSYDEDDVVAPGVFQIEDIMRTELGLGDSQIDTASFDALDSGARVSHFSLTSQMSAYQKCADIATDCGLILFTDHLNKIKVVSVLDDMAYTFNLTENDLLGPNSLKVYHTPASLIANEFVLRYRYNYITGSYSEEVEVSDGVNTLADDTRSGFRDNLGSYATMCGTSKIMYNVTRKIEIEAPHLRDKTEADKYLKQIINWRVFKRYILELDCPLSALSEDATHTTADIEIGDVGIMTHTLLPLLTAGIAGSTGISGEALFIVTKVIQDPKTLSVHFTLRETPYSGTE